MAECDKECERLVKEMSDDDTPEKEIKPGRKIKNTPDFSASQYLYDALGVDVTQIYGMQSTKSSW